MKISAYLNERGWTTADFARALGVKHETARLWALGRRTPRAPDVRRIVDLSEGKITPNDIYDIPLPAPNSEAA